MGDVGNAQAVIPYLAEIHKHYREAEVRARPRARASQPRDRRIPP
jgi:hypothetical protein